MRQASSRPLPWARTASDFIVSPRLSSRSKLDAVQLQLAGLDLGEVEDVVDQPQQGLARSRPRPSGYSRCRGVSWLSSTSSVMPMMAFIGVRISWLMLARKSALGAVGGLGRLLGPGQLRVGRGPTPRSACWTRILQLVPALPQGSSSACLRSVTSCTSPVNIRRAADD